MQANSGSHAVDFSEGIGVDSEALDSIIGNQASLGKHKDLKIGLEAKKNILDNAQVVSGGSPSRRVGDVFTGKSLAGSQMLHKKLSGQDHILGCTTRRDVDSTRGPGAPKKSNIKLQGDTQLSPIESPAKKKDGSCKISAFKASGFQKEINEPSDNNHEFKPKENPFSDDQLSSVGSSVQDYGEIKSDFHAKKMIKQWQREASDLFQSYQTNWADIHKVKYAETKYEKKVFKLADKGHIHKIKIMLRQDAGMLYNVNADGNTLLH